MSKHYQFILVVSILLPSLIVGCTKDPSAKVITQNTLKTVSVDEVYSNPARYTQLVKMSGKIVSTEQGSSTVLFGCEDACIRVAVHYNGELPESGLSAFAIGKVVKKDGKFMFEAQKIETK